MALTLPVTESEGVSVADAVTLAVSVAEAVNVTVTVTLGVTECEVEGDLVLEKVEVADRVADTVGVGDSDAEAVVVSVRVSVAVTVSVAETDSEAELEGVTAEERATITRRMMGKRAARWPLSRAPIPRKNIPRQARWGKGGAVRQEAAVKTTSGLAPVFKHLAAYAE